MGTIDTQADGPAEGLSLDELVSEALEYAAHFLDKRGWLTPAAFGACDDGVGAYCPYFGPNWDGADLAQEEGAKEAYAGQLRVIFAAKGVRSYAYVSEVWTVRRELGDRFKGPVSAQPDRVEAVAIVAVDADAGRRVLTVVPILRPNGEEESGALLASAPIERQDLRGDAARQLSGRFFELVPDEPVDPVDQVRAGIALRELAEAGALEIREAGGANGDAEGVN